MTPEELLDDISIRVWEPPFSAIHDNGMLRQLDNPLSVVVLLITLDTEYNMNGVLNFIGNSSGRYFKETVSALEVVGAKSCAKTLGQIYEVAQKAGMTHESIQEDLQATPEFAVTSWREMHGDRWEEAEDVINKLGDEIDLEELWSCAQQYAADHYELIQANFDDLAN